VEIDTRAENMSETDRLINEMIAGHRIYLDLLRNYQHGNHEKIMAQLAIQRDLEQQLIVLVGREAAFELEAVCYQQVLSEYL
jgi:hypothetical protein